MKRRNFLGVLLGAATAPVIAKVAGPALAPPVSCATIRRFIGCPVTGCVVCR